MSSVERKVGYIGFGLCKAGPTIYVSLSLSLSLSVLIFRPLAFSLKWISVSESSGARRRRDTRRLAFSRASAIEFARLGSVPRPEADMRLSLD